MSTKPKIKSQPNGTETQHLAAVPADGSPARTATEIKLWKALARHPGATTAELARHATIGTSTAGKILPRWHQAGHVTRTPGRLDDGHRRAPGTWAIRAADDAAGAVTAKPAPPGDAANSQPQPTTTRRGKKADNVRADGGSDRARANGNHRGKLRSGELHGMVEDFLREPERVGGDYTPGDIARVLGRSSGAVYNCLRKLDESGVVEQSGDKPRRYRLSAAATDG